MVWRIVLDAIWRRKRGIPFGVFQFYLMSSSIPFIWPVLDPMGFVLIGAGFLAIPSGVAFQVHELYRLPVARRTWWVAQWWLAVAAAVTIPVVGVSLGQWVRQSRLPSAEEVVIYGVAAFLYCGCTLALLATFRRHAEAPATRANLLLFAPLGLAFVAVSLLLGSRAPHRFSDIGAAPGIVMLVMAAWTTWGYRHRPDVEPRPSRGGNPLWGKKTEGSLVAAPRSTFADRFTGLHLAFWDEGRAQLITFAALIALLILNWAIASNFRPVPALGEFLRTVDALPFSSARARVTETLTWCFMFFFANTRGPWIFSDLRRLRALPLSANQLSCLPLALGLQSTIALWVVLLSLHLLVLDSTPVSPRADLFMAFAGFTTLAHAIRFIVPGQLQMKTILPLAPVGILVVAVEFFTEIKQPAMFVGGVVTMVASVVFVRWALARTSRIYRQPTQVVRLG